MRLRAILRGYALVLCCVWAACSGDGDGVAAPNQVVAKVGAKGGRVELRDVVLDIPEGALDKELKISVQAKANLATPASAKKLSEVYEFGPPGTKFKKDIEVRFKLEKEQRGAVVFFTKEDEPSQFEKLDTTRKELDYVAKVKHFSAGFVGVDDGDAPDAGVASDGAVLDSGGTTDRDAAEPGVDADQPSQEGGAAEAGGLDASRGADAGIAEAGAGGGADASGPTPDASTAVPDASTSGRIAVHVRDDVGAPANYTWAAFQDGTGAWQRLLPTATAGTYEFDVKSARYGVAFVCADAVMPFSWGIVRYAAVSTSSIDVQLTSAAACRVGTPQPMHTVFGPITRPAGNPYYRYGHANVSQLNNNMGATTLIASAFPGGTPSDLITGVGAAQDNGLSRVLVLRDLNLSADLMVPFDFVASGHDVGPTYSVLVSNADASATLDVLYTTRGEKGGMPMRQGPTSTPSANARLLTYASLPLPLQRASDSYLIRARETVGNFSRTVELRANLAANQSFSMPANFAVSFNMETEPYMRPAVAFGEYAGATRYTLSWGYFENSSQHVFDMQVDADYLGTAAMYNVTFPDFSAVPGFGASWVPPSGTTDTINLGASAETYAKDAASERTTSASQAGSYRVVP